MNKHLSGIISTRRLPREYLNQKLNYDLAFPQLPDASPDPILITNTKAEIYYVNPAWEKLTGYRFQEVSGKNPRILNSGKTSVKVYKKMWESLLNGKSFSTDEICDRRKDGTEYQIHSTFFPIRKNHKNLYYVQIMHDITKRKFIEDILLFHDQILISMSEGVAIIKKSNKKFVYTNPAFERMFGYEADELLGKYVSVVNAPTKKSPEEKVQEIIDKLKKDSAWSGEVLHIKKDGTTFWCQTNISTFKHHTYGDVWIAVHQDITERKILEKQKDAFIGIASHELKTPITTLSAYTQILEKRLKGDTKNEYFLENIKVQTNRLLGLIDDLLNVSRIDSGKISLKIKPFNINALVKKIIVDFQYTTASHEFIHKGTIKQLVPGDENRIEQVIINLLSNAVKYSPQGKKVIVSLSSDKNYGTVAVQDFGLGIPKEDQAHIFERFYRTKEKDEGKVSGFGLGLYICSEIIKKHKGKIWVESEKGKGSTFNFSLPLSG
jgi:PAS domain S-box-containing protein